jgi:hypothetical protein
MLYSGNNKDSQSICLSLKTDFIEITFKEVGTFPTKLLKIEKIERLVKHIHAEKIGSFDYLMYEHNFLTGQGNLTHYHDTKLGTQKI